MARLIPNVRIKDISHKPERDVARALVDQLSENVTVYHSYPWLSIDTDSRTRNRTLRESETDFLILSPNHGLLALEVKGGDINYISDTRRWYRQVRDEQRDITDPIEQVSKNLHNLVDRIEEKVYLRNKLPFPYGYAIVFPDCRFTGGPPPGAQPVIIWSFEDLPRMETRVANALQQWARNTSNLPITSDDLRKVKQAILPEFNLYPVLSRTLEEQEEQLVRLTEDQIRILEFLGENERAAIEGVAGSGKTLVAKAQVSRFASERKKTLFLCYNKRLAEWVDSTIDEDDRDYIVVQHFHGLCSKYCRKAGITFQVPDDDATDFWNDEAPILLLDALESIDDRFDVVVVDEGQDFRSSWWDPIDSLNNRDDEGNLYVFYDPVQNLYIDGNVTIPSLGTPYRLPINCRNTRSIAHTCGDIIEQEIKTRSDAPLGDRTDIATYDLQPDAIAIINAWVKNWFNVEGIKPSQIAILSPYQRRNSILVHRHQLGRISVVEDLEQWRKGEGVLFSTIRSFKGLEADIIILIDLVKPGTISTFSSADFYVASSRAKHILKMVVQNDQAEYFQQYEGGVQ